MTPQPPTHPPQTQAQKQCWATGCSSTTPWHFAFCDAHWSAFTEHQRQFYAFSLATGDEAVRLAATRHLIGPGAPNMSAATFHRALTSADVADLRASLRGHVPPSLNVESPSIRYAPAGDVYELHYGGLVRCTSRDPGVLATLLRGERMQPGYILSLLRADATVEEALLDPDARAAAIERGARQRAAQRASDAERTEAARRARTGTHTSAQLENLALGDLL